jgi:hypothetical protein
LLRRKTESVFRKNEGLRVLEAVDRVLRSEATAIDDFAPFTPADVACLKYAPLTSVDVERTFSMLRALLRENRESFKLDALRMHVVIHCNAHVL